MRLATRMIAGVCGVAGSLIVGSGIAAAAPNIDAIVNSTCTYPQVIAALNAALAERVRWSFWKCYDRMRNLGHPWNHKRVHRVYCALLLNLPRRTKRRVPARVRQPLVAPARLNETWALDFMIDALYDGRGFRTLNVIDEGNREGLAIEIGTSIPSARVIRVLDDLIRLYGRPTRVRVDNGPELTAEAFVEWCRAQRIGIGYIQPGKPDQNAFIERFNRTFREEVLDAYLFDSFEQVREITEAWLATYNTEQHHDSLGRVPPLTFRPRSESPLESTVGVST